MSSHIWTPHYHNTGQTRVTSLLATTETDWTWTQSAAWEDAGLRYSPRLLGRPESTDFIGCFPLRSLRCQQQKNKIVAIVPSKSNSSSSTHWMLYGLNRTKNAAAIIIRRDVEQIPQPQTAGSSPRVTPLKAQDENKDSWLTHVKSRTLWGSEPTARRIDIIIVRYNAWLSREPRFIYLFLLPGAGSQQIHLSIAVICCSRLVKG